MKVWMMFWKCSKEFVKCALLGFIAGITFINSFGWALKTTELLNLDGFYLLPILGAYWLIVILFLTGILLLVSLKKLSKTVYPIPRKSIVWLLIKSLFYSVCTLVGTLAGLVILIYFLHRGD